MLCVLIDLLVFQGWTIRRWIYSNRGGLFLEGDPFRDLVKRRSCEQCDGKIVASSVQEGESSAAGKKVNQQMCCPKLSL